jgi:hypothetical protein
MTAIVSQFEELERNHGELETTSTTLINRKARKFPGRPIAVVSSVHSIAQTSVKNLSTGAKSYYLPQGLQSLVSMSLMPCLYQLRTIEEQPEKFDADDIAVHTLARPISGQNIGFVQASARVSRGKFLTPSTQLLSKNLPRSQNQLQDVELYEEKPFWGDVFTVSHKPQVLFSKDIEVKVNDLPDWKPHIVIDSYFFEDDDE